MRSHFRSYMAGVLSGLTLVSLSLIAQEQYTVPPTGTGTAQNQADVTANIVAANANMCEALGLSVNCTQAQACPATKCNAAGGASCTAVQARAAGCRIWPNTTALERSEFVTFQYAQPAFNADRITRTNRRDYEKAKATWAAASVANRNIVCTATAIGLANGCDFLTLQ